MKTYIKYEEKPILTEEDLQLRWQPVIYDVETCPHCGGAVNPHWIYDPTDPRPWADPTGSDGFICTECKAHIPENEIGKTWLKDYSVYLNNQITQEEYKWFFEHNENDIRNYKGE